SVQRKTDKKLPRYWDGQASDTFVLSEMEDLVPVGGPRVAGGFTIQRYRPRIEGGFSLVERWTDQSGLVHWRTRDRSNVLRTYGATADSRLRDPNVAAGAHRVFAWYLCEEWDERGNGVRYIYDSVSGTSPGSGLAEHQRTVGYHYLKRIQYGNVSPGTFDS